MVPFVVYHIWFPCIIDNQLSSFHSLKLYITKDFFYRSLKCARITIHINLFVSFAANNSLWLMWYRFVLNETAVIEANKVIFYKTNVKKYYAVENLTHFSKYKTLLIDNNFSVHWTPIFYINWYGFNNNSNQAPFALKYWRSFFCSICF